MNHIQIKLQLCLNDLGPNGENWCKKAYALNRNNEHTFPQNINACKWCSMGILHKYFIGDISLLTKALQKLPGKFSTVEEFNDNPNTTFEDIRKLFTVAIEEAGKVNCNQ